MSTFEFLFEALEGDPTLGKKIKPACFYRFFMSKWWCSGLFPVPLQEGDCTVLLKI